MANAITKKKFDSFFNKLINVINDDHYLIKNAIISIVNLWRCPCYIIKEDVLISYII